MIILPCSGYCHNNRATDRATILSPEDKGKLLSVGHTIQQRTATLSLPVSEEEEIVWRVEESETQSSLINRGRRTGNPSLSIAVSHTFTHQ